MPAHDTERIVFLDWLRIGAFGLLVLFHVGMYYVSWDWHLKSPHASDAIEPLMRLSAPWRLSLLFLVSGAATGLMLRTRRADLGWLGGRARRLAVPLLFGILVVVPPQSYLEVVQRWHYEGDYVAFLGLYFRGYGGFCRTNGHCLILPTWNHLWFLAYLLTYTVTLWALLQARPRLLDAMAPRLLRALRGVRLLLLPIAMLALVRLVLRERFPPTHALVDDAFNHVQYGLLFLLGAVLSRSPALWARLQAARWPALLLAFAGWGVSVWGSASTAPDPLARAVGHGVYALTQWCAIVAAVGFAHRHLTRDGPWRRYLTQAVFPVYVLHQTATILLAWAIAPAAWPVALEASLLVVGTFAVSFLGFELARRTGRLGRLIGVERAGADPAPDHHRSIAAPSPHRTT